MTTTTLENERTEAEIAKYEKAQAIKAELKQLAKYQKHNKLTRKNNQREQKTDAFILKDGSERTRYCSDLFVDLSQYITLLHIVYNELRNRPSHLKDQDAYLDDSQNGYARRDLQTLKETWEVV